MGIVRGTWIGVMLALLGAGAPQARGAPSEVADGRLERSFARLERLLRAQARSASACGSQRFYLAVSREGLLQLQSVAPPAGEARCGLLGKRSSGLVTKVRVNVHSLSQVGAPLGKGRVTLHCLPQAGRCVQLTLESRWGTVSTERRDRLHLALRPRAAAVAGVARAARRFLYLVKNDVRYTRPSTRAERRELRNAGRPLRNWGLVLTIGGVACLATGSGLLGYARADGSLGAALFYGYIGVPFLLTGIVATLVGLPVLFSGLSRLSRARDLDREADEVSAAPPPTAPVLPPRTLADQLAPGRSSPLSWSLRLSY